MDAEFLVALVATLAALAVAYVLLTWWVKRRTREPPEITDGGGADDELDQP